MGEYGGWGTAENKPGFPDPWVLVQVPGPSPPENNRVPSPRSWVPESYSLLWVAVGMGILISARFYQGRQKLGAFLGIIFCLTTDHYRSV